MGYSTKKEVLKYKCINKNVGGKILLNGKVKVDRTCRIDLSGDVELDYWVHLGGNTKLFTHFHNTFRDRPMLKQLDQACYASLRGPSVIQIKDSTC